MDRFLTKCSSQDPAIRKYNIYYAALLGYKRMSQGFNGENKNKCHEPVMEMPA